MMDYYRSSPRRSIGVSRSDIDFPMIDNLPAHWDLLHPSDLDQYVQLRTSFYDEIKMSKKGERLESFIKRLKRIREFVERGDGDDWKRGLVCGIIFLSNGIAIHIQQFRLLLGKCKSSINGSLQQIGFIAHPQGGPIEEELCDKVPIFRKEHSEVKKWTVRDCNAEVNPLNENTNKTAVIQPEPTVQAVINQNAMPAQKEEKILSWDASFFPIPIKFRYKYDALFRNNLVAPTTV